MNSKSLRIDFENFSDERDVKQFLSELKYVVVRVTGKGVYKYKLFTPIIGVDGIYYSSDIYTKIEHSLTGYIGIFSSYVKVDRICRIINPKDINVSIDKYYTDRESKEIVNKFTEIRRTVLSPS